MTTMQLVFNYKKNIWSAPLDYRDLSDAKEIAIDLETKDDGINNGLGAGWATGQGKIVGFAVATEGWQGYYPMEHFGGGNLIKEQVLQYMQDVCALPCRKIFHNAQYDVGWLRAYGIEIKGPSSLFRAGSCCKLGFDIDSLPDTVPPESLRNCCISA